MKNKLLIISIVLFSNLLNAQDDIYDAPEPVKIVPYKQPNSSPDPQYEEDYDYNPNFDYQYSRRMNRMYNSSYMMPTSAYMNMWGYPAFNSFYNPYAWGGGSGFSISIGNSWGNGWNNPYYSSFYSPWGFNSCQYGMGWNSWNNPWGYGGGFYNPWGFNNFYSPYYYGSGYGNYYGYSGGGYYNRGYRQSNVPIQQNRLPRPSRVSDNSGGRGYGSFQRPNTPTNTPSSSPQQQQRVIRQSGGIDYYQTTPPTNNPTPTRRSIDYNPAPSKPNPSPSFSAPSNNGGSRGGSDNGIRRGRF